MRTILKCGLVFGAVLVITGAGLLPVTPLIGLILILAGLGWVIDMEDRVWKDRRLVENIMADLNPDGPEATARKARFQETFHHP